MNKAVPWNVNGVGFDAREAAREAARRQGKSLGEWLHGVISDHAADLGVEEHEVAGQQRIDAITSKLERMSARSADHDRRHRLGRPSEFSARRSSARDRDRDDEYEPREPRRSRARSGIEETEFLLEEAIDAMERRAARAERRTDDALDSFAKLLERNEANRERERDSVNALAQKLTDIEARLADRGATDDNPIKGALARLESRLESIGKRSSAEGAARLRAAGVTPTQNDDYKRLDDKLNSILDAMQSGASPLALAASQDARPKRDRRLGDAIAEIARRQDSLDGTSRQVVTHDERNGDDRRRAPASLRHPGLDRRESAERRQPSPESRSFIAMQSEIAALATTIESLRHEVADQRRPAPQPQTSGELDALRAEIAAMSVTLRQITTSGSLAPRAPEPPRDSAALTQIQDHMREIRDFVATSAQPSETPEPAETQHLETLVRELGEKMEAVQTPGAGTQAIDALQQQVSLLADRFARSDDGLAKLTSLERSMRELFTHLEETRASVETSAARAAREALRIAMEEGRAQSDLGTASSIAALHDLQADADARTASTLTAVHGTLERVIDRLAAVETDMAGQRRTPAAAGSPAARTDPTFAPLGLPDSLLAHRPGEAAAKPAAPKAAPKATPPKLPQAADLDLDGAGRSDFIAAARRAAKVAQSDPALAELKRPGQGKADSPVRAGLIAQTRDYVAQHKRPILLSIAALFVVLGTMAVIQRVGLDDGGTQLADTAAPPARVATLTTPAPRARTAARQDDELSPSALPQTAPALANPIPGSDPIQTGSISARLPSFAAANSPAAAPRPRPTLPAHLVSLAEAGDSAAEYTLGTQYAEGASVPRDFAQAAKWYQKAAAQNLAPAQYRLASLYEKGLGVTKDKIKAKSLYLQAAEAGNPRAMHNLAVLLADGDGKPDYEGAATWFRKAAQYGVHDSQYNLAILLARGIGLQQSFVQSYQWFAIAAAQGDADAGKKRDEVGARLTANDLAVAKALSASFRPRTADIAATDVQAPAGGWDGGSSSLASARKVSSL